MAKYNLSPTSLLDLEFSTIQDYISQSDVINLNVSKVSVAWHLDHILKTINVICKSLEASDPKAYKSNFNLTRVMIYAWGDFPRGIAKAPRVVRPPEVILTDDLHRQIDQAKKSLKAVESLDEKVHFEHPYFAILDKKRSMRFLKIHTGHHLKIVRDIVKK